VAEPRDSLRQQIRPTYWKEGALIGGALGAVGGALLAHRLCGLAEESTKNCARSLVLGGVLGAALLALPGALIGGQVSKQPVDRERPD
jgi:tetrahydromethanopterin S-methyltransferase subunit D